MKVVIVGAGGLVGGEFARQLASDHDIIALRHTDLDITEGEAVHRAILEQRPSLIINCAVLGVDACECDRSKAWSVNVAGAENLAKAAKEIDAELVQFSSNYVFDGQRARCSFYTIDDSPNPINVYGETKLAGERAVQAVTDRYFIVRTSWVFGPDKDNFFSRVSRSLRSAEKIRAITDVWASATYVRDLVSRTWEIVSRRHYATYHVVNSGLCSYYEFALEAARLQRFAETESPALIEKVELRDLQLSAPRPYYSPMACKTSAELGLTPMRDWREALNEFAGQA